MKKGLLAAVAVSVLFAFNVEARDMRGHGGHHGRPGHHAQMYHGKGRPGKVVVINRGRNHYRPRTYYSYSYFARPVYNESYYYALAPLQSVFFSNRNFSFGLSNFLW